MHAHTDADDLDVSRFDHDDGWTVAVDLGPGADEAVTVDLVGDTAIVAVDAPGGRTEFDVSLPEAGGHARLNNGVLVVEAGDAQS
ncbi:DUF7127 family protein [Haloarcula litorea]|uniref:DUF7127 family protein n=1 Tax=Haloarcula litorea TaxID=3032579 RepID=UPI0023E85C61|nr:hypothetical protein [Halomicroarcula sp. GDY20]